MKKIYKTKIAKDLSWWEHLKENPLKAITMLVLTLGGLLMLVFFVHIDFMPDVDLASSTAVLAAVALIGLLVLCFIGLTAVAPGALTSYLSKEWKLEIDRYAALAAATPALVLVLVIVIQIMKWWEWIENISVEALLVFVFSFSLLSSIAAINLNNKKNNRPVIDLKLRKISIFVFVPFIVSAAIFWEMKLDWVDQNNIVAAYIIPPILFSVILLTRRKKQSADSVESTVATWKLVLALWFVTAVWVWGIFLTFYLFILLSHGSTRSDLEILCYSLLWLFFTLFSNIGLTAVKPGLTSRTTILFAFISCYFLLILSANLSVVSVISVRALGLGSIENTRVSLTSRACRAFNLAAAGSDIKCEHDSTEAGGSVCPVTVMSRIGSDVLLEWNLSSKEQTAKELTPNVRRIAFNKSDVTAWTVIPVVQPRSTGFFNSDDPEKRRIEVKKERDSRIKALCTNS
jgi:hypothetical protein